MSRRCRAFSDAHGGDASLGNGGAGVSTVHGDVDANGVLKPHQHVHADDVGHDYGHAHVPKLYDCVRARGVPLNAARGQ